MGMLAGKAEFINPVLRFKSNMDSGMFLPLQMAAVQALQNDKKWFEELNKTYKIRQQKVFEMMQLLDCQYDKNQTGMFVWAKIPTKYSTGYQLSDEILEKSGVFITPGGIFGTAGDGYIRTSLCAEVSVFEEAILRIRKVLSI